MSWEQLKEAARILRQMPPDEAAEHLQRWVPDAFLYDLYNALLYWRVEKDAEAGVAVIEDAS